MRTIALALVASLFVLGCNERPEMKVDPLDPQAGTAVWARFDRPISGRAADQYWIVIAPAGAPPEYKEGRLHVNRSAEGIQMEAPATPGSYEVRLHGDFPRKDFNVVRVVPIVVRHAAGTVGSL